MKTESFLMPGYDAENSCYRTFSVYSLVSGVGIGKMNCRNSRRILWQKNGIIMKCSA